MERRKMIRQMALLAGSIPLLPYLGKATSQIGNDSVHFFEFETMDAFIDAMIPAGKTPGALELGVSDYVKIMLLDCQSTDQQNKVKEALSALEIQANKEYKLNFNKGDLNQRINVLKKCFQNGTSSEVEGLKILKSLTIKGYQTTEYFMKNIIPYEMAPNRYNGCVSV